MVDDGGVQRGAWSGGEGSPVVGQVVDARLDELHANAAVSGEADKRTEHLLRLHQQTLRQQGL